MCSLRGVSGCFFSPHYAYDGNKFEKDIIVKSFGQIFLYTVNPLEASSKLDTLLSTFDFFEALFLASKQHDAVTAVINYIP